MPAGGPWCSCAWSPCAWSWSWACVVALMMGSVSSIPWCRSLRRCRHVVDGGLDGGVGKGGISALGRHRAPALQRGGVKGVLAFLQTRRPRGLVAELRRAGRTRAVARHADGVIGRLAVGRFPRSGAGGSCRGDLRGRDGGRGFRGRRLG